MAYVIATSHSVSRREEAISSIHYQPRGLVVGGGGCFVASQTDWLLAMT